MINRQDESLPFVSIIIPCLNEKNHISLCFESILDNSYPRERTEIIVIDGMSEDGTRDILKKYSEKYSFIKFADNPKKITPAALNIGIKMAKGDIIVRMDAHSSYESDYIQKCVKYLKKYNADNVGGICITVPREDSFFAEAISMSLMSPFGVGNSYFRIRGVKEKKWVDTVPFGCFPKEVFNKIGLYDETYHRNEDIEFNRRLRKSGGKILLVPDIQIKYYTRSNLKAFAKHHFDNGLKVTYPFSFKRMIFSARHYIPLLFISSLILSGMFSFLYKPFIWIFLAIGGSYLVLNLFFSTMLAFEEKNTHLLFLQPVVFLVLHVMYGFGSIVGIIKSIISKNI